MPVEAGTTALVAAVIALDLLIVWYAGRHVARVDASPSLAGAREGDTDDPGEDAGTRSVTCPNCGAENDGQFRYCRRCVTELPGTRTAGAPGADWQTDSF